MTFQECEYNGAAINLFIKQRFNRTLACCCLTRPLTQLLTLDNCSILQANVLGNVASPSISGHFQVFSREKDTKLRTPLETPKQHFWRRGTPSLGKGFSGIVCSTSCSPRCSTPSCNLTIFSGDLTYQLFKPYRHNEGQKDTLGHLWYFRTLFEHGKKKQKSTRGCPAHTGTLLLPGKLRQ